MKLLLGAIHRRARSAHATPSRPSGPVADFESWCASTVQERASLLPASSLGGSDRAIPAPCSGSLMRKCAQACSSATVKLQRPSHSGPEMSTRAVSMSRSMSDTSILSRECTQLQLVQLSATILRAHANPTTKSKSGNRTANSTGLTAGSDTRPFENGRGRHDVTLTTAPASSRLTWRSASPRR